MADTTTLTEADMRPGERLVRGARYVFNQELLNRHLASEAVANAPGDLSVLSDSDLKLLSYQAVNVAAQEGMADGAGRATLRRTEAEYRRRGWDTGGATIKAAASQAAA